MRSVDRGLRVCGTKASIKAKIMKAVAATVPPLKAYVKTLKANGTLYGIILSTQMWRRRSHGCRTWVSIASNGFILGCKNMTLNCRVTQRISAMPMSALNIVASDLNVSLTYGPISRS